MLTCSLACASLNKLGTPLPLAKRVSLEKFIIKAVYHWEQSAISGKMINTFVQGPVHVLLRSLLWFIKWKQLNIAESFFILYIHLNEGYRIIHFTTFFLKTVIKVGSHFKLSKQLKWATHDRWTPL